MKHWLALSVASILIAPVLAHEVVHRIESRDAVLVSLTFADGKPLAYEKYELYAGDEPVPVQVGNTDAHGRIAFVPEKELYRLKAFTADGHGVDLRFAPPVVAADSTSGAPAGELPRPLLIMSGLGLLFGLFGLWQLFVNGGKR